VTVGVLVPAIVGVAEGAAVYAGNGVADAPAGAVRVGSSVVENNGGELFSPANDGMFPHAFTKKIPARINAAARSRFHFPRGCSFRSVFQDAIIINFILLTGTSVVRHDRL
jgi:hypothetical protein